MNQILIALFILSIAIIGYHYLIYPIMLSFININRYSLPKYFHRNYAPSAMDALLPSIHIVIPAYNEEQYIEEKILNLAIIDYPEDKLKITVVCDGSQDNTYNTALKATSLPECRHLQIEVVLLEENIGKIAIINQFVQQCCSDIVGLSDSSAIISINCLLVTSAYLNNKSDVGAVCGSYQFVPTEATGEQAYWNYQRRIKIQESILGSTIGLHGAFYAFKTKLFQTIPEDTINDDVILPLNIIRQGLKCLYDPRLMTVELEHSCQQMSFQRRIRITSGNVQHAVRNFDLISPKFGWFAFNFFSGKFLRPLIPVFLIAILISSSLLASEHWFFTAALFAMFAATASALYYLLLEKQPNNKLASILFYIIAGHIAMTVGVASYAFHSPKRRWQKIEKKHHPESDT